MIAKRQVGTLIALVGKLKTKSIGSDNFEKFVAEKRSLKAVMEGIGELETELIKNYEIVFTDESQRFFDLELTTLENRDAFNKKLEEILKKEVETTSFLSKKELKSLVLENDLTIDEYELLTESFLKVAVEKEKKGPGKPPKE